MRIIRIEDGNYPMTEQEVRDELGSGVCLPIPPSDDNLRYVGYAIVQEVDRPSEDHWEVDPIEIDGVYIQQWQD